MLTGLGGEPEQLEVSLSADNSDTFGVMSSDSEWDLKVSEREKNNIGTGDTKSLMMKMSIKKHPEYKGRERDFTVEISAAFATLKFHFTYFYFLKCGKFESSRVPILIFVIIFTLVYF